MLPSGLLCVLDRILLCLVVLSHILLHHSTLEFLRTTFLCTFMQFKEGQTVPLEIARSVALYALIFSRISP